MKTLAKSFLSLSPKLKVCILAIVGILAVLFYQTSAISLVHAQEERNMKKKLDEIQSLSSEWNRIDEQFLKNEEEIRKLQESNAEIKRQQGELSNQAREMKVDYVRNHGCKENPEWCDLLKLEYVVELKEESVEVSDMIVHKGFKQDDERQKMVQYAYKLGGIDFVKMIECENGNWDIKAVGDNGYAFGLCQIHIGYHSLPEGYKNVWQTQVEYCYKKRSSGTKFYGPDRNIKGQKCSSYVSDRFIINNG